jgi:hypothetical protein
MITFGWNGRSQSPDSTLCRASVARAVDTFARSCDLSTDVQWWSRTAASCGRPLGLSLTAASTPESGGSAGALCLQRGQNVLLGQFGNQRVECDAVLGTPSTRLKRLIVSSNASEPCGKAESTSDGRMSCPRESGLAPDSPLERSGFEPSVPLRKLSSIRAVGAEIIGRRTDVFRRDREFDVTALQGRLSTSSQRQCSTYPGSDLASTTFPEWGPMVRIRFPPAESPSLSRNRLRRSRSPASPQRSQSQGLKVRIHLPPAASPVRALTPSGTTYDRPT